MNTYSHLTSFIIWPDTGPLIKALDDGKNNEKGKPIKMFKYLGKTEENRQQNLKIFQAGIANWTTKGWGEITKEEISKMKLMY